VYKGNDNYYLEATTDHGGVPGAGGTVGSSDLTAFGTTTLAANAWTHLAETYDGTALRLYVNGAPAGTQALSGSLLTSANPLQIGGDSIFGQYFAGLIDEVRVYNVALSAAQIQADMNTPIGLPQNLLGDAVSGAGVAPLTQQALRPLLDEAVARWQGVLGNTAAVQRLRDVHVEVMDLPGARLGLSSASFVWIDVNA